MAEIKVRSGELKRKAEELAMLNSKYRQEVEKMVQHEIDLAGMWDGDAQKAFRPAFNTDKQKMDIFAQTIDKYVEALRQDADTYEQAESKAHQIGTTRKS